MSDRVTQMAMRTVIKRVVTQELLFIRATLLSPMDNEMEELVVHGSREGALPAEPRGGGAKTELSVDEIIEGHVGALGRSQILQVFLVSLAWIFDSQGTLITIFADAQPAWRCKAHAAACSPGPSMCHLAPGSWEWVDGEKSSTVAEWGLICDRKFRAGIPASVFFLGSLFGSAVHGRLADKHLGRKKTVLLSCLLTAVTGFVTSLSPNVWVYALLRFSNGFARSGIGICCLVLATEAVGRKWRGQVGQYGFFFFTVGFLSLPAIAYPTRTSWRTMYRVTSLLPLAYSVVVLPFVFESPRWLAVRGRTKEAMDVLTRLAKLNGKTLSPELAIANPVTPSAGEGKESLWSARWAIKRMLLMMLTGFGIGFLYYGVQLNVENLDFNIYFTVAVNALMEIPAVFLGSVLLAFADRRLVFSSSSFAAAASCVACIFLGRGKTRTKGSWPQLTVEAIGFMAASLAFDVLYIYCVELFPTNVRNLAVSVLRQSLMLGAAIAPQLVVLGRVTPKLSFLIFACFALFSASLTIWLPETRNTPLYETMAQQEKEEKQAAGPGTETELPKRDSPLPDA